MYTSNLHKYIILSLILLNNFFGTTICFFEHEKKTYFEDCVTAGCTKRLYERRKQKHQKRRRRRCDCQKKIETRQYQIENISWIIPEDLSLDSRIVSFNNSKMIGLENDIISRHLMDLLVIRYEVENEAIRIKQLRKPYKRSKESYECDLKNFREFFESFGWENCDAMVLVNYDKIFLQELILQNYYPTYLLIFKPDEKDGLIHELERRGYRMLGENEQTITLAFNVNIQIHQSFNEDKTPGFCIYEYKTKEFKSEYDGDLESTCLHRLKDVSLNGNLLYFAAFWSTLVRKQKLKPWPFLRLKNAFTVCQPRFFRQLLPNFKAIGITHVFTPHVTERDNYDGITIVPIPLNPTNGIGPAKNKDIHYSFVGSKTHPIREKIFSMPKKDDVVVIQRGQWHHGLQDEMTKLANKKEFQDILARSRFSLCPPGSGPNTIRIWESLQAGAIPILIKNYNLKLPKYFNEINCMLYINEEDIENLDEILSEISAELESEMRKKCIEAYKKYCADVSWVIRDYFEND